MTGLFAPRALASLRATYSSVHLGQAIAAIVVETVLSVAPRSASCARTFGEAAMPSSLVVLYWAFAELARVSNAMPATAAMRVLLVVFIIFFLLCFQFRSRSSARTIWQHT